VHIRPPFHLEYGTGVSIGAGTFFNYDFLLLDVAPVTIGAACEVASRVQLSTATHPIDPSRGGWDGSRRSPGGVVAMGVPARALREIGEQDRIELPRQ
jgi:maltose O-acetyltransferase